MLSHSYSFLHLDGFPHFLLPTAGEVNKHSECIFTFISEFHVLTSARKVCRILGLHICSSARPRAQHRIYHRDKRLNHKEHKHIYKGHVIRDYGQPPGRKWFITLICHYELSILHMPNQPPLVEEDKRPMHVKRALTKHSHSLHRNKIYNTVQLHTIKQRIHCEGTEWKKKITSLKHQGNPQLTVNWRRRRKQAAKRAANFIHSSVEMKAKQKKWKLQVPKLVRKQL